MDMNKLTAPSLPAAQHILEDLTDPSIIQTDASTSFSEDEIIMQKAYNCYSNFKQLEEDQEKQTELYSILNELNRKLVDNIEHMKSQAK